MTRKVPKFFLPENYTLPMTSQEPNRKVIKIFRVEAPKREKRKVSKTRPSELEAIVRYG